MLDYTTVMNARVIPAWVRRLDFVLLLCSIPLAVAFAVEGNTGSFLLQVSITMGLLNTTIGSISNKIPFFERFKKSRTGLYLMLAWCAVEVCLLFASLFFLIFRR